MAGAEVGKAALSRREREVAALVADGLTNRAIAERLFISERTVDGHLEHIREKLGVTSRAQVAAWYVARPAGGTPAKVATPAASLRRRRSFDALLLVAAVLVLTLVAGLLVPKLLSPAPPKPVISYTGATDTPFDGPRDVAVGDDGFVYVTDEWNYAIKRIDPKHHTVDKIAGGVANGDFVDGSDAFKTSIGPPFGLAVAPDGTVFFSNGQIVGRVDTDKTVHLVVTDPRLRQPVGLSIGPNRSLYIADRSGNRVWWRAATGEMKVVAGNGDMGFGGDNASALDAQLNHPVAVAVDAAGDVLIADKGNNRIRRVDAKSGVITTIAGSSEIYGFAGDGGRADRALLSLPIGVAMAPNGEVFISDTGNDRVRRVGKDGTIATVYGAHGELSSPGGLAVSASGDLYIADIVDNRIVVVPGAAAG
jgi:DNA-binding CsgD family transcriptional regulator/streptogramin lyase